MIEIVVTEGGPPRLDKALAQALPERVALSRSRLRALIEGGHVSMGGAPILDPAARVAPGQVYRLDLPAPAPAAAAPEDLPLDIRHEDADLIVLCKPPGQVVHPAPGAPTGTLVNALLHHCGDGLSGIGGTARPGIVHRIDKDTSGLLVIAKTDIAHKGLSEQFAAHTVEREYLAICRGVPSAADPRLAGLPAVAFEPGGTIRIDAPLGRHPRDRKKMAVVRAGRRAVTRIRVIEELERAALLSCRLETGRTHQIRVHLAHIGHPILGDPVYGSGASFPAGSAEPDGALPGQALHARTLGFVHPVSGEALSFAAEPPPAFNHLLIRLRQQVG